ncbi:ABC transporter ATP-binding protein [Bacillus sp. M6-12]|uniref:ABC transporter ATP-binding protein n=1 Tax=Bacillus sp. M6-12 TaxID=2054166 RepID=UPI000C775445|nr:ABC transporter ATP-binding protein [Bacillus sp. M6-12]PLS15959.1 ABC transporter ATP-binding protein [Bacillus sp. M6-12]
MIKVLSFLKPYRFHVAVALSLMLVELAVELCQPMLIAKIIDQGILRRDLDLVLKWGMALIGMSLFAFASGIVNSFFASHVSQSFGFDIRKSLFEKVQSFSFSNLSIFPNSSLITRMTNDVNQMQNTVFMSLRIMMRAPLLIIGGMIMAFFVHIKLALILAAVVPVLLAFLIFTMTKAGRLFKVLQSKLDSVNEVLRENLAGMRLIKAFLRRSHERKRFATANRDLMEETVSALRLIELALPVLLLIMNAGIMAVLWFGSAELTAGTASAGEIVAIVNYATKMTSAFSVFTFIIMAFSRARASAQRIADVLNTEADMLDTPGSIAIEDQATLRFENVSFSYPGANAEVLHNISFNASQGQMVAIMGATGSGKTSLFQLIPRLYDNTGGSIEVDGVDIRNISLEALRGAIGYVPQESLLFTGTVRGNISWGKENASMDEIMSAAKIAQIHETIEKLPAKYDTLIGQKGVNLSGGQKQRIAIARALVRKPKLLLLDDSTSALDVNTEERLLRGISGLRCTTLIITQKISTAKKADKIILIEDGTVLAKGNHEELLKESGLYQRIHESQAGKGINAECGTS